MKFVEMWQLRFYINIFPELRPTDIKNYAIFLSPESAIMLKDRPFLIVHSVASLMHIFFIPPLHQLQDGCAYVYSPLGSFCGSLNSMCSNQIYKHFCMYCTPLHQGSLCRPHRLFEKKCPKLCSGLD